MTTVKQEIEEFDLTLRINVSEYGEWAVKESFGYKVIGRHIAVWYLDHDSWPGYDDYLSEFDAGTLYNDGRFSKYQCDEGDLEAWNADGTVYFFVDKYDHGQVHYSLRNSTWYPDRQWDVATGLIYVPPQHMQEHYHKIKYRRGGKEAARAELAKYAQSVLREYTDWCNGNVYGCVATVYDKDGEELLDERDACWGYIGWDYALESLKEYQGYAIKAAKEVDSEQRRWMIEQQRKLGRDFVELMAGQVGAMACM